MESQISQLKQFIETANRILITSHIPPDPDALTSVLLLAKTLQVNYPNKQISAVLEEVAEGLDFLPGYELVQIAPIESVAGTLSPDLFIMVDVSNLSRTTKGNAKSIADLLSASSAKIVTIDHHQPDGRDEVDIYINRQSPATVQDIYAICFNDLQYKKPDGYAEITMTGLYSDTGGFIYPNARLEETLKIIGETVATGLRLEDIHNKLNQFSYEHLQVIGELASNMSYQDDYNYSFISDEFSNKWLADNKPVVSLKTAAKRFVDTYIRNVGERNWGFIVYHDQLLGADIYAVSLRSIGNLKDVDAIAKKLGGGGHKPAAGAKLQAKNLEDALKQVKQAINQVS